jgi:hypothetical protein
MSRQAGLQQHPRERLANFSIADGIPDDIHADYLPCYDSDRFAESMRLGHHRARPGALHQHRIIRDDRRPRPADPRSARLKPSATPSQRPADGT